MGNARSYGRGEEFGSVRIHNPSSFADAVTAANPLPAPWFA